jgi:hypothetical protein
MKKFILNLFLVIKLNFITLIKNSDDIIITEFISEDNISYVNIGSGEPIIKNNTFKLCQRGWNGILIDPLLNNYLKNINFGLETIRY